MDISNENMFRSSDPHLLDTFKLEMSQGIERFFLLSYCLACCWPGLGAKSDLRVVRQWSEMQFVFPSEEAKQIATERRFYVPGNSVPIDVDVHHRQGESHLLLKDDLKLTFIGRKRRHFFVLLCPINGGSYVICK